MKEFFTYILSDCRANYEVENILYLLTNFITLFLGKLGILNILTIEINNLSPYKLKIPYVIPITCQGYFIAL